MHLARTLRTKIRRFLTATGTSMRSHEREHGLPRNSIRTFLEPDHTENVTPRRASAPCDSIGTQLRIDAADATVPGTGPRPSSRDRGDDARINDRARWLAIACSVRGPAEREALLAQFDNAFPEYERPDADNPEHGP